jgi:hypothetical protein
MGHSSAHFSGAGCFQLAQPVAAHQHHQGHQLRSLKKIWGSNKNLLRPLVALAFFVYYGKTI